MRIQCVGTSLVLFFLIARPALSEEGKRCSSNKECYPWKLCEEGTCHLPVADWRSGLELELQIGTAICLEQEDRCKGEASRFNPGVGASLYGGYRFTPYTSLGLNVGYFPYTSMDINPDFDQYARIANAMMEFRGILPMSYRCSGFGDVYLKLGLGYVSTLSKIENLNDSSLSYEDTLRSPLNIKLGIATTFFIKQKSNYGDFGIGLGVDYLLFFVNRSADESDSNESGIVMPINALFATTHVTWVFPSRKKR